MNKKQAETLQKKYDNDKLIELCKEIKDELLEIGITVLDNLYFILKILYLSSLM